MYRKFEGEADRSHHGPAPNRLYSTAHNMRTWISEGKASRTCLPSTGVSAAAAPSLAAIHVCDDASLHCTKSTEARVFVVKLISRSSP